MEKPAANRADGAAARRIDGDHMTDYVPAIRQQTLPGSNNPRTMTGEMKEEILARIVDGQALARICKDEHIAAQSIVYRELQDDPVFRQAYVTAREMQADVLADKVLDIATADRTQDTSTQVQRDRLTSDNIKWFAAVTKPHKYSPKAQLEHSSPGGEPLIPSDTRELAKAVIAVLGTAVVTDKAE